MFAVTNCHSIAAKRQRKLSTQVPAEQAEGHEEIEDVTNDYYDSELGGDDSRDAKSVGTGEHFTYKVGIDESRRPLSDNQEMFDDLTKHSLKNGLENFLNHLQGRKLRVGTMCSGTESPILALQMIHECNISPVPT